MFKTISTEGRADHKKNMAKTVIAIAQGKNTKTAIRAEVKVEERTVSKLIKELKDEGRIVDNRPSTIQPHDTRKSSYSLSKDLDDFLQVVDLIGKFQKEHIKEFMNTNYYLEMASKLCKLIASHSTGNVSGCFLIYRSKGKKDISTEVAWEAVLKRLIHYNEIKQDKNGEYPQKNFQTKRWTINFDPLYELTKGEMDIKNLLGEVYETNNSSQKTSSMGKRHVTHGNDLKPLIKTYKDIIYAEEDLQKVMFHRVQRCRAIVEAAYNDHIGYDTLYKTLTTFPDSLYYVVSRFRDMIAKTFKNNFDESKIDLLFYPDLHPSKWLFDLLTPIENASTEEHVDLLFHALIDDMTPEIRKKFTQLGLHKIGKKVFYISFASIAEQLFLGALMEMNIENAIIPDSFIESYLLKSITNKE